MVYSDYRGDKQFSMAFFGPSSAVLGLDIGTSSLKVVELIARRKGLEVATYAQANLSNLLTEVTGDDADEIAAVAATVERMLERAGVATDKVVAALPSSVVFSTVLTLPDIPDQDMEKAVTFAARDVVPANLEEMVLGWSRLGQSPHMATRAAGSTNAPAAMKQSGEPIPVFLTAAPQELVTRYTKLMERLHLELLALEVETFPLVRALLAPPHDSALIVDIGDRVTTFHIIDRGTARVSHTTDYGGHAISSAIAQAMAASLAEAEEMKVTHGLGPGASDKLRTAITNAMQPVVTQATQLLGLYQRREGRNITKSVLIGGGANLRGIAAWWSTAAGHTAAVGNPWRGLAYPKELGERLQQLGPTYAVAVGLAQRGFATV